MQAITVRERTGCSETDRKAWNKSGILIPSIDGAGSGVHASYDEANLVAVMVAMAMKANFITVSRYVGSFQQLHDWLRQRSSIEWRNYQILMAPNKALFIKKDEKPFKIVENVGFYVDLYAICEQLQIGDPHKQLPLNFGLHSVG